MSKAPAPKATCGGSPGEPNVICAAAGHPANTTGASPIAAAAVCLPIHRKLTERLTAAPLACPASLSRILEAIGSAGSETAAFVAASRLEPFEPLARQHQLFVDSRLHRGMPSIGHDDEFGLRPGARQLVGATDRANHIVAALHDDAGQMADAADTRDEV